MVKRRVVSLFDLREEFRGFFECMGDSVDCAGVNALVSVENQGWCRDGFTMWYHYELDGVPCVTYVRKDPR